MMISRPARFILGLVFVCTASATAYAQTRDDAGRSRLVIGGKPCDVVSVEGGEPRAEVVAGIAGADRVVKKHIGAPRYGDVIVTTSFPLSPTLEEWMTALLASRAVAKDGEFQRLDSRNDVAGGRSLVGATLREVVFPTLDVSGREPMYVKFRLAPERTVPLGPGGKAAGMTALSHKRAVQFELVIEGLDCKGVTRIESFAVVLPPYVAPAGDVRDYEKETPPVVIPNLVVIIAASQAATWEAWLDDFVVKGNCGDDREKNGTLQVMQHDKTVAFSLKLKHLGILSLKREPATRDAGSGRPDTLRRLRAELYCEAMELVPAAPAAPTPDPAASSPTPTPTPEPPPGEESRPVSPEDKGARDPAGVPRMEGTVRTSFTASKTATALDERAEYVTKTEPAKVEAFISGQMKDLGWKETGRSESGDAKLGTYVIDSRYERERQNARVWIRLPKEDQTTISWVIITQAEK